MTLGTEILSKIQKKIKNSNHPFFVVDLGHIVRQHLSWIKEFPRIKPYYSVKCQPDSKVIQVLNELGVHFDCSSQSEIEIVQKFSSDANKIIFSNPFKFRKDIQYASSAGINLTSFDSLGELEKLKKSWPSAQLLLRTSVVPTSDKSGVLEKIDGYNTEKFGAKLRDVPELLRKARELEFDVVGLSFHVGIMNDDWNLWSDALKNSVEFKEVMIANNVKPKIINIGGGFPGRNLVTTESVQKKIAKFDKIRDRFNDNLNKMYPEDEGYEIIGTPGTHYVFGAYTLATQIIGKRTVNIDNISGFNSSRNVHYGHLTASNLLRAIETERRHRLDRAPCSATEGIVYIIDDGVYGSFNNLMFIDYTFFLLGITDSSGGFKKFNPEDIRYKSKIYGPTCDTFDCLFPSVELPELHTNDWLIWADMGAYTNAKRTGFNGIPSPNVHYIMFDEDRRLLKNTKSR